MIKRQYKKSQNWIELHRFPLLLIATLMAIVLPAFAGGGLLSELVFVITLTFLFLQSMVAADIRKSRRNFFRITVLAIILITWLKPVGVESIYVDVIKLILLALFFSSVVVYLLKFIRKSKTVSLNVLLSSIIIYLLAGIVSASLAMTAYIIFPGAYNLPDYLTQPRFVHFLYFSFITMATVGYGDITPRIPETQTLAYLMAITGQLYVAIIIAFLVGKFLVHSDQERSKNKS